MLKNLFKLSGHHGQYFADCLSFDCEELPFLPSSLENASNITHITNKHCQKFELSKSPKIDCKYGNTFTWL